MSSLLDEIKSNPRSKPVIWTRRPEILLMPRLPLAVHGLAPRLLLGSEWWDVTRQKAALGTNYCCIACTASRGSTKWSDRLEGHEVYAIDYLLATVTYKETVPLCWACHLGCHPGIAKLLTEQGVIPYTDYSELTEHWARVRSDALSLGMQDQRFGEIHRVNWNDWRMMVDGRVFKPLTKSYKEYLERYPH